MRTTTGLVALVIQLLTLDAASAGPSPTKPAAAVKLPSASQSESRPSKLCSWAAFRDDQSNELGNPDGSSLSQLLGVHHETIRVSYASSDWQDAHQVLDAVRRLMTVRPRHLSRTINWSEGADFSRRSFAAAVSLAGGGYLRIEASGYQVCISDLAGQIWYFRDVPVDTYR